MKGKYDEEWNSKIKKVNENTDEDTPNKINKTITNNYESSLEIYEIVETNDDTKAATPSKLGKASLNNDVSALEIFKESQAIPDE